jgi:hypothetical protein
MPIYLTRGHDTGYAQGDERRNPKQRENALSAIVGRAGGKLVGYHETPGQDEWLLVTECADEPSANSVTQAVIAAGGVTGVYTRAAMTTDEGVEKVTAQAMQATRRGLGKWLKLIADTARQLQIK